MKTIACALLVLSLTPIARASDKDVLRDACSTLKPATKKSACFDALDRISALPAHALTPPPEPVPAPKKLKVSLRGMQCEAVEYAELDSMQVDELEGLYCSYDLGAKTSKEISDKMVDQNKNNPNVQTALLTRFVATMERCVRGLTKSGDALRRKFPLVKADCTKMPERKITEPDPASIGTEATQPPKP